MIAVAHVVVTVRVVRPKMRQVDSDLVQLTIRPGIVGVWISGFAAGSMRSADGVADLVAGDQRHGIPGGFAGRRQDDAGANLDSEPTAPDGATEAGVLVP